MSGHLYTESNKECRRWYDCLSEKKVESQSKIRAVRLSARHFLHIGQ